MGEVTASVENEKDQQDLKTAWMKLFSVTSMLRTTSM